MGCEVDTRIIVSKENPPKFTFSGSGGIMQFFISGPYTLEEINILARTKNVLTREERKQLENAIPGDNSLWQLDPQDIKTNLPNIAPVTYGIVPREFRQIYPENNIQPVPLIEGKYYRVSAPSYSANFRVTTFLIKDNKAVAISVEGPF